MKKLIVVLMLSILAIVSCTKKEGTSGVSGRKVYLITMDQMDQHWVKVNEGATDAAKELGDIDYSWVAPDVKDDNKQIEAINNAVAAGANLILIAPNGPDAVTASLREATDAGVKIIYVDSSANFPSEQFIATDNKAAGKSVGESLKKALSDKGVTSGNIGVVGVNAATASTVAREAGFKEAFAGTGFVILETQYSQGDAALAKDIAANFISQGVVGLYGSNEGATVGVGNAVKETGGTVIGVGSDASDMNLSLINDGSLYAIMAQSPYQMGYQGIQSAAKVLNGQALSPDYLDTGVDIITK